jgi:hypothetical protein
MLRPDPAQQHRLVEIIANLHERLTEARERGWFGEIEGLEASLAGAEQKLAAMRRTPNPVASGHSGTSDNAYRAPTVK